nr:response regulator [Orenia metallireducens]
MASNGEEALEMLNSKDKYNLIILDIMMPKVDGIEVCRKLREATNIPIIMLSAKDAEIDKVLGLRIGADDYITKPFNINELIARVKDHLRRFFVLGSDNPKEDSNRLVYDN